MHEYRQFVQRMPEEEGWRQSNVGRNGSPSRRVMSATLRDNRPSLNQRSDQETIQGLAKTFGADGEKMLASVAAAMRLPTTVNVVDLEAVSNEELFDEIRRRIESPQAQHNPKDPSTSRQQANGEYITVDDVREHVASLATDQEPGDVPAPSEGQKTDGVNIFQPAATVIFEPGTPPAEHDVALIIAVFEEVAEKHTLMGTLSHPKAAPLALARSTTAPGTLAPDGSWEPATNEHRQSWTRSASAASATSSRGAAGASGKYPPLADAKVDPIWRALKVMMGQESATGDES